MEHREQTPAQHTLTVERWNVVPVALEPSTVESAAPQFEKTELMLAVEAQIGEPLEIACRRMYEVQGMSGGQIADALGIGHAAAYVWLDRFDIQKRDRNDKVYLAERIKNIRATRLQAQEDIKPRPSQPGDEGDPGQKEHSRQGHSWGVRAIKDFHQKRMQAAFGEDRRATLSDMHHVHGLTIADISRDTGFAVDTIVKLFQQAGVAITPKTHIYSVKRLAEALAAAWRHPERMRSLSAREREVFDRRFLTEGHMPTNEEVGTAMGVKKQAVNLYERNAIAKLKGE